MSLQGLKREGSFLIGFRCCAGSLGATKRILSFQGLAALVTMWFLDPPAKLWVQLWLSFSSLSCNKKVRLLAIVLGFLSCVHLEQGFHMVIQDLSWFLPAVWETVALFWWAAPWSLCCTCQEQHMCSFSVSWCSYLLSVLCSVLSGSAALMWALCLSPVHEGTLVHAVSVLALWCARFTTEVPKKLVEWLKKAFSLKTSTSAVRHAYLQCMLASFKGKTGQLLVTLGCGA